MSALQSLFLLLIVAYLGGFLMGGRGIRGVGLPSGSEWLVLGIVAGPSALGVVSGAEVAIFAPLAILAAGWIAMIAGLVFGVDGGRRTSAGGIALGLVAGVLSIAGVAAAVDAVLLHVPAAGEAFPAPGQRLVLVVGISAALADTSRRVATWARERLGADGPLLRRVADVALADDLAPILAVSLLVSLDESRGIHALPAGGMLLGAVLGGACALLLGRQPRPSTMWSLVFGFSLLAIGSAVQLDVAPLAASFAFGLALAALSPVRDQARKMAVGVMGAVIIPALFLSGARSSLVGGPALWIAAAAIGARIAAAVVVAGLVALSSPAARRGGPALALAFFAPGPLGIAVALAVGLRFQGAAGDLVLSTTVAAAVLGEFLGPPALRRALRRAGEAAEPPRPDDGAEDGPGRPADAPPAEARQ